MLFDFSSCSCCYFVSRLSDWVERIDKDVLRQGLEQENSQTSLDESVYQGDIELDEAWPGSLDDDSGAVSLLPSGRLEEKQFWMDHVYGIPYEIGPHFRKFTNNKSGIMLCTLS